MPRWLQGIFAPTLMLWLFLLAFAIASAANWDRHLPPRADYVSRAAFSFLVAWWVVADARKRRRQLCYDYDGLLFFFWPLMLPVYLFQTRRWRAFLTLLYCGAALVLACIIVFVIVFVREFLLPGG